MKSLNRLYISQVDELRAIAAVLVFFFHANLKGFLSAGHSGWPLARNPLEAILLEGHSGVSLFLFLSGFILCFGMQGVGLSYWSFIRNRVLRIFPLAATLTIGAIYANKQLTLDQTLAPFLLLQNTTTLFLKDASGLIGTLWTVSVEFQLYLVAPFMFLFIRNLGLLRYAIPMALLIIVIRVLILFSLRGDVEMLWSFPYLSIIGRFNQFMLGAVIAANWGRVEEFIGRGCRAHLLVAVGMAGVSALSMALNVGGGGEHAWHWWRVIQMELEAGTWGAFAVGYISVNPLRKIPVLQCIVRFLGLISFSLYLFHWALINDVFAALPLLGIQIPTTELGDFLLALLVILPISIGVSTLSWACIERPFLGLRRSYIFHART